jgi:hypothetical protein
MLLHATATNALDIARLLQDLARDVERQIVGIDDPAHETQVYRHQLLGVVHDEDATHIELDAVAGGTFEEIEGGSRRDVQELRIFLLAFDTGVHMRQRIFEIMRNMLVELLVLLVADLRLGASPQGRSLVHRFVFVGDDLGLLLLVPFLLLHHDRQGDVVGILADDLAHFPVRQKLVLAFTQVQGHFSAALRPLDHLDREIAFSRRFPTDRLIGLEAGTAGYHRHLVGDDIRRIETDAELADQMRVLGLVAGQRRKELAGSRFGDCSEVLYRFFARQADAVVGDAERPRRLVEGDADLQIAVVTVKAGIVQGLEAQPVAGVGSVGDQLAQKDLLVAVQRMNHQIQQLFDFCLKTESFLLCTHVRLREKCGSKAEEMRRQQQQARAMHQQMGTDLAISSPGNGAIVLAGCVG